MAEKEREPVFLTSTTGRRRRESAFVYIMHPRACISRSASMYLNEKEEREQEKKMCTNRTLRAFVCPSYQPCS